MLPYFKQPVLNVGPLPIHAFGVLVALACIVGLRLVRRRARRTGLDEETAARLVGWILACGFVGAHLVDRFVYFPRETLARPISILLIWEGLSSFGGFVGAVAGAAIFVNRAGLGKATWRYLDAVAWAFPFGWILGRAGCFVAYDHPGAPTTFFLGQTYKDGVVRHNLGLEEMFYAIAIAVAFAVLGRRERPPGFFIAMLAILYAPVRFFLDFFRMIDVRYGPLTPGQYGAIVLLLVGVAILARTRVASRPVGPSRS